MANVTVKLVDPIEIHDGSKLGEIVLRAPKFSDIMALGEPAAFARSEGGMIFTAERDGVIEGYIRRLLVEPKDPGLLAQLSIADTLQMKDAINGFFNSAREAILPKTQIA